MTEILDLKLCKVIDCVSDADIRVGTWLALRKCLMN